MSFVSCVCVCDTDSVKRKRGDDVRRGGHSEEDVLGTQGDSSSGELHFGVNPAGVFL